MKLLRFRERISKEALWGIVTDEENVHVLEGDPLGQYEVGDEVGVLSELSLLSPCEPRQVLAAAKNYFGVTDWEDNMEEPLLFTKSPQSVCSATDEIRSYFSDAMAWGEPELAVVIGRRTFQANPDEAKANIFGYTIANDVTAENQGDRNHHLIRSKGANTFCPLGHFIDTEYDPSDKDILAYHNDVLIRKGNTRDFFWEPTKLISKISEWLTLEPWDIILTGAPPMQCDLIYFEDGDRCSVQVEGFPPLVSLFRQVATLSSAAEPKYRGKYFK